MDGIYKMCITINTSHTRTHTARRISDIASTPTDRAMIDELAGKAAADLLGFETAIAADPVGQIATMTRARYLRDAQGVDRMMFSYELRGDAHWVTFGAGIVLGDVEQDRVCCHALAMMLAGPEQAHENARGILADSDRLLDHIAGEANRPTALILRRDEIPLLATPHVTELEWIIIAAVLQFRHLST